MTRHRIAAALVAAAVLSACGSDDTAEPDAGATVPDTVAPTATNGSGSDPTGVDEDAVFVFGYIGPGSLDPVKSISSFEYPFFNPVFDSLVTPNADGTLSPGIAESWELSDDGTTFTMTIAEGRTFHDGTLIDAEAVKANLERAIDHPESTVADLDNVESVAAAGNTVTLTVSGAGGRLPAILADIPGMMVSPASFESAEIDTKPIGSGPFTVVEVGDAIVRYEKWDGYHAADDIHLAGIEIVRQLDDNTRLAAVRSGEIDATYIQPSQSAEAESAGLSLVRGVQNYVYAFNLNTTHAALAEPDVRKAISQAIDRDAINEGLNDGACQPTVQPYPASSWPYAPEATVERYSAYNPDAARALLASAGYPDGFEIEIGAPNATAFTSLLEVFQAQLGEIGITVTPIVQEPAQYVAAAVQGDYDSWVTAFETGRPDPLRFWQDNYMAGGGENPEDYSPEGFAELFDEAANTVAAEDLRPILHEMVAVSLENGPRSITICVPDQVLVMNERVNGLEVPINGNYSFRGVTESEG